MEDYVSRLKVHSDRNLLAQPTYDIGEDSRHGKGYFCHAEYRGLYVSSRGISKKAVKQKAAKGILSMIEMRVEDVALGGETPDMENLKGVQDMALLSWHKSEVSRLEKIYDLC